MPPSTLRNRYANSELGRIAVSKASESAIFDFGEWKTPVASRKNADGTLSFISIVPGMVGMEFVAGEAGGKRTLTFRDAQHEYVFNEH